MRRAAAAVVSVLVSSLLLMGAGRAYGAGLTVGFLPPTTDSETIIVRGTAPRGQVVAISVGDSVQVRVVAGPDMDVYHHSVAVAPGPNRLTIALEGTDLTVTRSIFRRTVTFTDVTGHWAQQDIEMLATLGVVNGVGGDAFGPDQTLTRAQFAKLMVLGMGVKLEAAAPSFADAAALPDWSVSFVAAASASGLIKGYEDGTFRPSAPVSRVEMAVIAARALRLLGGAPSREPLAFTDAATIPDWAREDVALATGTAVIDRYWGDAFRPAEPGTRAEAAALARRLWSLRNP